MPSMLIAWHQGIPIMASDVVAQETEATQNPLSLCARRIDARKDR